MKPQRCCEECRYWERDDTAGEDGTCHRRAPIAARADDFLYDISLAIKLLLWWSMREWSDEETAEKQLKDFGIDSIETVFHFTLWPATSADDWCGEWELPANEQTAETQHEH